MQPDPWGNIGRLDLGGARLTLVEGDAFLISDPAGDLVPGTADGFYHRDTRFLDRMRLLVDGRPPELLSSALVDPFSARIYLRAAEGGNSGADGPIVEVRRFLGDGVHQDLLVSNTSGHPVELTLELQLGADFADVFEVKRAGRRARRRVEAVAHPEAAALEFRSGARRGGRATWVQAMPEANPVVEPGRIVF